MGPERLDGAVLCLDSEGDVEELLLVPDVGEGATKAAFKVVPSDVVVLGGGSHVDGGVYDAVKDGGNETGGIRRTSGHWTMLALGTTRCE